MADEWDALVPTAPRQRDDWDQLLPEKRKQELQKSRFLQIPGAELARRGWQAITGEGKAEFPQAPEFGTEAVETRGIVPVQPYSKSLITSDPEAGLDILRKSIPGLQARRDNRGNLMLRAPEPDGSYKMQWSYLNKPGLSRRDAEEILTQTLATLWGVGRAGTGASIGARFKTGVALGGAAELGREGMERAAGSEQQPGAAPLVTGAAVPAAFAPGVPSAAVGAARTAAKWAFDPIAQKWRLVMQQVDPKTIRKQAEQLVAGEWVRDIPPEDLRQVYRGKGVPKSEEPLSPVEAGKEARRRLAITKPRNVPVRIGQEKMIMDVGSVPVKGDDALRRGTHTQRLARAAANLSPEARQHLDFVITDRFRKQADRANTIIRDLVGVTQKRFKLLHQSRDDLIESSKKLRQEMYDRAYDQGNGGFSSPMVVRLLQSEDEVVKEAVNKGIVRMRRRIASGVTTNPVSAPNGAFTLETWDMILRSLRDQERKLVRSGASDEALSVGNLRRDLTKELTAWVPDFDIALTVAARLPKGLTALEAGEEFFRRRNMTSADVLADYQKMHPYERELFKTGYVTRLLDYVDNQSQSRNLVTYIGQSGNDRDKMAMVLGPHAKHFETFLLTERIMDDIRHAVGGNSTTVRQWIEAGAASALGAYYAGGFDAKDPFSYFTAGLAAALAGKGARVAQIHYNDRFWAEVARVLTSRDAAAMERGLQALSHPRWLEALRRLDRARGQWLGAGVVETTRPTPDNPPQPLPENKAQLRKGAWYKNSRGQVARFDGQGFVT